MHLPTETNQAAEETSIFYTGYEKEVLEDNLAYGRRKSRNNLLVIAAIFLAIDLLSLVVADALSAVTLLYVIVFPLLFTGLAFLALKSPVVAMVIALVLFVALLIFNSLTSGIASLFGGWMWKCAIIYLLIAGFRHARESEQARKELELITN
jgi:hypothetical protein